LTLAVFDKHRVSFSKRLVFSKPGAAHDITQIDDSEGFAMANRLA